MFGSLIKLILALAAAAVALVVLVFGFMALNLMVVGPWKHDRNTRNAETLNDTIWQSDVADIYKIGINFSIGGKKGQVVAELICARKTTTETISLKGGPYSRDYIMNIGDGTLRFPVSDDYEVEIQLPSSCPQHLEEFENGKIALLVPKGAYGPYLVARQLRPPNKACGQAIFESRAARFGTLQVFSPTILSKRTRKIKNVISRENYGPADLAIIRESRRQSGNFRNLRDYQLRGELGENCWADWGI